MIPAKKSDVNVVTIKSSEKQSKGADFVKKSLGRPLGSGLMKANREDKVERKKAPIRDKLAQQAKVSAKTDPLATQMKQPVKVAEGAAKVSENTKTNFVQNKATQQLQKVMKVVNQSTIKHKDERVKTEKGTRDNPVVIKQGMA